MLNTIDRFKYRNKKILAHAKGQPCQMRLPGVCNRDPSTTVAAHSNLASDGKGLGTKAHDYCIAYLCSSCHDVYDRRTVTLYAADELQRRFEIAMKKTWLILLKEGVLK